MLVCNHYTMFQVHAPVDPGPDRKDPGRDPENPDPNPDQENPDLWKLVSFQWYYICIINLFCKGSFKKINIFQTQKEKDLNLAVDPNPDHAVDPNLEVDLSLDPVADPNPAVGPDLDHAADPNQVADLEVDPVAALNPAVVQNLAADPSPGVVRNLEVDPGADPSREADLSREAGPGHLDQGRSRAQPKVDLGKLSSNLNTI